MPIALVSHVEAQGTLNAVTSAPIDTTGASLLVVALGWESAAEQPAITDSEGNTWSEIDTSAEQGLKLFYCASPRTATAHTFTAAGTAQIAAPALAVSAFSGTAAAPLDQSSAAADAGPVTAGRPGAVQPAQDEELVVTAIAANGTGAPGGLTANDGFLTLGSLPASRSQLGIGHAILVQSAAAAANPTLAWTGPTSFSAAIASFRSATGNNVEMSIRSALYNYLAAQPGIGAIVGSPPRICPVKLPQNVAQPALLYRRIKGGHAHDLSGSAGFGEARFELNCLANTYADADALAEAVRQAADGAQNKAAAGVTIRAMLLADDEDESDEFFEPIDGSDNGVFAIQLRYDVLYDESAPTP